MQSSYKQAFLYTIFIVLCIFIFLNWITLYNYSNKIIPTFNYIEVALGTDIVGNEGAKNIETEYNKQNEHNNIQQNLHATNNEIPKYINNEEDASVLNQPTKNKNYTNDLKNKFKDNINAQKLPKAVLESKNIIAGINNENTNSTLNSQGNGAENGLQGINNGNKNSSNFVTDNLSVFKGDRKIVKALTFKGNVEAATIYATILVSPEGNGSFVSIEKGSSSNNIQFKNAIINYLPQIEFDKMNHTSKIIVKFIFEVQ